MNPFFLVGIVILVFAVTLLAGFMIRWEMAHRSMLKRVQAVSDAAARVAQKLSVGHPATAAEDRRPIVMAPGPDGTQVQQVKAGPPPAQQGAGAPRPFEHKGGVHAPPPARGVKPSNHRGDGDSAQ